MNVYLVEFGHKVADVARGSGELAARMNIAELEAEWPFTGGRRSCSAMWCLQTVRGDRGHG
jgi:hypothetical protein